ncbi:MULTISPECIES: helix-turn-helix domain-containing protein [Nocardia]|uniref:helix-turn-helix domain-containing protein n=1 Tax=Nocardia TaxID=1817 RepID=UPI0024541B2A|nr:MULTISPECIES: helix-turn-helix transcriptional regulator [Nocardia]
MDEDSIGARIKRFRGPISQREVAERAEIHVDVIRKLEQGKRNGAAIATLHKIARALDVDIADLVGKRYGVPSDDKDAGVVAIRRALTSVNDLRDTDAEEPVVSLPAARRSVDYAWGAYWNGRYELLSTILPTGITQLRATAHAAQGGDTAPAHDLLARMYWVTGCTLVHLGQADPAFIAIRSALTAAEKGDDPLLLAMLRGSVAWQLLVQGRYEEAHGVALKAAAGVEPAGDVSNEHLSVYGSLILQSAVSAGRDQRTRDALDIAGAAGEVADRIGADFRHYESDFGPSAVVMQKVDINVSSERYPEALAAAKAMPNRGAGLTPVGRARHLTDQAAALVRLGRHQEALDMLLTAERVGGQEWLKYQTLLRQVVGELLENDRRSTLRAFADRLGVRA